ncbi:MAG TPA: cytochrome c biogenesis protein CcdA [Nitrospirales bacterium]|jgi:cytochrome c-type biogenesis protein|nr:cytochrome c biogenesis protein CcdA [Nitrospirales bacterium]
MFPQAPDISLFIAFAAGLLSFVSPCVLPLVPSYVTYITGLTLEELTSETERARVRGVIIINSLLFIAGFSAVFIAFGASASLVGQLLMTYQEFIRKLGGVLIVVFGLYVMGVLKIKFLMSEMRVHLQRRPAGYVGSVLVGVAFAAGWTPCVGPILGTILLYAGTVDSVLTGVKLLASYSLGIALPLFITALAVDSFLNYFKKLRRYMYGISVASGVFLVLVGVMIYTNSLTLLTSLLERHHIGWYIGQ